MTEEERRLKWNKFCDKYVALLDEYDVDLDHGCGCCSGTHLMDGSKINEFGEGWSRKV